MPTYRTVADPLQDAPRPPVEVVTGPAKRIPRRRVTPDYDGRLDPEDRTPVGSCRPVSTDEALDTIARMAVEVFGQDAEAVLRRWSAKGMREGGDARFAQAIPRVPVQRARIQQAGAA